MRFTLRECEIRYSAAALAALVFSFLMFTSYPAHPSERSGMDLVLFKFYERGIDHPGETFKYLDDLFGELERVRLRKPGDFVKSVERVPALPEPGTDQVFSWQEKLREGRERFRILDLMGAAEILGDIAAVPKLFKIPPAAVDVVREATALLSFIKFKLGEREESERLLRSLRFFRKDPNELVRMYPPDFVEYAGDVLGVKRGVELVVTTLPSGAKVFVNGGYLGETPLVREVSSFGKIRVNVKKNGYVERELWRMVLPGERVSLNITLPMDEVSYIEKAVSEGNYEEAGRSAEKFLERTGNQVAVVTLLKRTEPGGEMSLDLLFVTRGIGRNYYSLFRNLRVNGRVINSETLIPLLEDDLVLGTLPEINMVLAGKEREKKEEKITSRWWFWTLVALGAAGIVYGLAEGESKSSGGSVAVEF